MTGTTHKPSGLLEGSDLVERIGTIATWATLGLVLVKLLAAQVTFGVAALAWLYLTVKTRQHPRLPAFFWPLCLYALLTVASAWLSLDRPTSLIDLKQLVLFLLVPVCMRFLPGPRATRAVDVVIATGAAVAVVGMVQAIAVNGLGNLDARPEGTLSHYMTYSGVIMLTLCAAVARVLFPAGPWIWPAIAVPALAVALGATLSRNVYIGAVVGIGVLLATKRAKLLLVVPVVIAAALLVGPVRHRAFSAFDQTDASNRDRVQMWGIGARIVHDYPWFGVGPDQVIAVYPRYRPADSVRPVNVHLHNVFIQIAAERGLLALGAWLTFVGVAVVGLFRQTRYGPAQALAGAGLAAVAAMATAGLFEHNFGDSEFLMLFLGLITLPFAAARAQEFTR